MINTKGLVLGNTVIKIIIAILVIIFVIIPLGQKAYGMLTSKTLKEQAETTMNKIMNIISQLEEGESGEFFALGPKGWYMKIFRLGDESPSQCLNNYCLCICESPNKESCDGGMCEKVPKTRIQDFFDSGYLKIQIPTKDSGYDQYKIEKNENAYTISYLEEPTINKVLTHKIAIEDFEEKTANENKELVNEFLGKQLKELIENKIVKGGDKEKEILEYLFKQISLKEYGIENYRSMWLRIYDPQDLGWNSEKPKMERRNGEKFKGYDAGEAKNCDGEVSLYDNYPNGLLKKEELIIIAEEGEKTVTVYMCIDGRYLGKKYAEDMRDRMIINSAG